jgi:hypothetical protein
MLLKERKKRRRSKGRKKNRKKGALQNQSCRAHVPAVKEMACVCSLSTDSMKECGLGNV